MVITELPHVLASVTREACIHDPLLLWAIIIGNLGTWLAYNVISFYLVRIYLRAPLAKALPVLLGYAMFIEFCSWTHFVAAVVFFRPYYGMEAVVVIATAIVSLSMAIVTAKVAPTLIRYGQDFRELSIYLDRLGLAVAPADAGA